LGENDVATKRGHYGNGTIDKRGDNSWRLRYYINGRRFSKNVKGTRTEAARELRNLLKAGDDGTHVAPNRLTLTVWIERWLELKGRTLAAQSAERYSALLKLHVIPTLGDRSLQKINATDIDTLFGTLSDKLSPRSARSVFVTLKSCLATAVKKGALSYNPADNAERASTDDTDAATVLDEDELATLVQGFRGTWIYSIVCVAAYTGARRNEVLALRWADVDLQGKTISITRSQERTKAHGRRVKGPKSTRGRRTIKIDDALVALLKADRERHLRLIAGAPEGADVNLSLIRLPDGALLFPSLTGGSLTKLQTAESVTAGFKRHAAKLGWPDLRFHDLRASHGTNLLDRGVGVHTVAERLGHDPAMLLRIYAKRTKKSDATAAAVIGTMTKGLL
jgi:integrase